MKRVATIVGLSLAVVCCRSSVERQEGRTLPSVAASAPISRGAQPDPSLGDPAVVRDRVLAELKASGPAAERPKAMLDVLSGLRMAAPRGVVFSEDSPCYAAGCFTTVKLASREDPHARQAQILHAIKERWSGPVFLSGPVREENGETSITVVLRI